MSKKDELLAQIEESAKASKESRDTVELAMLEATVAAQATHGADEVRSILGKHGFVIVKTPHPATFRKYADIKNPKTEDMTNLSRPCLVTDKDDFDKLLDKEPGLLLPITNACLALAGVQGQDFLESQKA